MGDVKQRTQRIYTKELNKPKGVRQGKSTWVLILRTLL